MNSHTQLPQHDELLILDKISYGRNVARKDYRDACAKVEDGHDEEKNHFLLTKTLAAHEKREEFIDAKDYVEAICRQSYLKTIHDYIKAQSDDSFEKYAFKAHQIDISKKLMEFSLLPYDLELYLYTQKITDFGDQISIPEKYQTRLPQNRDQGAGVEMSY